MDDEEEDKRRREGSRKKKCVMVDRRPSGAYLDAVLHETFVTQNSFEITRQLFIADAVKNLASMSLAELLQIAVTITRKDRIASETLQWFQSLKIAKTLSLREDSLKWLRRISRIPHFTTQEVLSTKVAKWLWQTSTSTRTTTDEVMILQCLFAAKLRKGVTPSNESQLQAFVNDMQAKTAALNAKPDTTSVANSAEHTLPTLRLFVLDGGVTSQADWDRCLAHVQREVVNGGIIACIPPHILLSEQSDHVQRVDWNERLLSIASHVTEHLFWDPETMTQYTVLVARFSTPAVHLAAAPPKIVPASFPTDLTSLRHRDIVPFLVATYVISALPTAQVLVGGTSTLVYYAQICFTIPIKMFDPLDPLSPDVLLDIRIPEERTAALGDLIQQLPESFAAEAATAVYQPEPVGTGGKVYVGDKLFGADVVKVCKEHITLVIDLSNGERDSQRNGWPGFITVLKYDGVPEDGPDELKRVLFTGQRDRGLPPVLDVLDAAVQRGKNVLVVSGRGVNR